MADADLSLARLLADSSLISPQDLAAAPTWELGRYQVLHSLGEGTQSEVYLAHDPLLGRQVALKLWRGSLDQARFRREMEVLARLKHPNIVEIYDAGFHGERPFFVMEHVPGATLESVRGSLRERVSLLEQVARACQFAHEQGVVHRDLKLSNILVAEGKAVVADFGVARLAEQPALTRKGALVGTPATMAPEQALGGFADIGPHTDVYALGALLYEQLCGRLPVEASDLQTLLVQLASDSPPQPPSELAEDVPELEAIALEALAKQPSERYASAGAMADALAAWLGSKTRTVGARAAEGAELPPAALVSVLVAMPLVLLGLGLWILSGTSGAREDASLPSPSASVPRSPAQASPSLARSPAPIPSASAAPSPSESTPATPATPTANGSERSREVQAAWERARHLLSQEDFRSWPANLVGGLRELFTVYSLGHTSPPLLLEVGVASRSLSALTWVGKLSRAQRVEASQVCADALPVLQQDGVSEALEIELLHVILQGAVVTPRLLEALEERCARAPTSGAWVALTLAHLQRLARTAPDFDPQIKVQVEESWLQVQRLGGVRSDLKMLSVIMRQIGSDTPR